jgi:hypothetical protein
VNLCSFYFYKLIGKLTAFLPQLYVFNLNLDGETITSRTHTVVTVYTLTVSCFFGCVSVMGLIHNSVRCSVFAREHFLSIQGWIHSQRRNTINQKLVVKLLVRTHTNLALRERLDDTLLHLLPWDIELVIDETRVWSYN